MNAEKEENQKLRDQNDRLFDLAKQAVNQSTEIMKKASKAKAQVLVLEAEREEEYQRFQVLKRSVDEYFMPAATSSETESDFDLWWNTDHDEGRVFLEGNRMRHLACKDYLKGECRKGEDCLFKHPPDCKFWLSGNCKRGKRCKFLHRKPNGSAGSDAEQATKPKKKRKTKTKAKGKRQKAAVFNQDTGDEK